MTEQSAIERSEPAALAIYFYFSFRDVYISVDIHAYSVYIIVDIGDSMIRIACQHAKTKKHGTDGRGNRRYRCVLCGKTFIDMESRPLGHLRISMDRATMVLRMMLEGNSLRAIHRLTEVDRETISALLLLVGERCQKFLKNKIRDHQTNDIEADELWSYVGCHERYKTSMRNTEEFGDCYTFLAIDRDSKLVLTYHVGRRDSSSTRIFVSKLRDAIAGNCQISTDAFNAYRTAIPTALWDKQITYGQIIKIFEAPTHKGRTRYSPPIVKGILKETVWSNPDRARITTSHAERLNLSLRMGLRRFTRLTNGYSKSWRHHHAAIALWVAFYNFCRPHMTLKTSPAVAAKLTDEVWSIERLLAEIAT